MERITIDMTYHTPGDGVTPVTEQAVFPMLDDGVEGDTIELVPTGHTSKVILVELGAGADWHDFTLGWEWYLCANLRDDTPEVHGVHNAPYDCPLSDYCGLGEYSEGYESFSAKELWLFYGHNIARLTGFRPTKIRLTPSAPVCRWRIYDVNNVMIGDYTVDWQIDPIPFVIDLTQTDDISLIAVDDPSAGGDAYNQLYMGLYKIEFYGIL